MKKLESHDTRYAQAIAHLRYARKAAGTTQAELAARLGTRQQFISKYESGERRLDVIEFFDVAEALAVEIRDLIPLVRGQTA